MVELTNLLLKLYILEINFSNDVARFTRSHIENNLIFLHVIMTYSRTVFELSITINEMEHV